MPTPSAWITLLAVFASLASSAAAFVYNNGGVFYLANCKLRCSNLGCSDGSYIFYVPDGTADGTPSDGSRICCDGFQTWEGSNHGSDFAAGGRLSWSIRSDAQSMPNGQTVGDAYVQDANGFVKGGLSCHKGDNHDLLHSQILAQGSCWQIYYCH